MKINRYITFILALFLIQCNEKPEFDGLLPYQEEENAYWGYIDLKGRKKIEPVFKEAPGLFYDGFAIIQTSDGSFDYINTSGEEYERNYVDASNFNEGVAFGVKNGEYPVLLNSSLEEVKALVKVDEVYTVSEGLACFKSTNGKWGFLNKDGDIVIEAVYDYAYNFSEGLAKITKIVKDTSDEKKEDQVLYGFIDKEGNEVIKPTSRFETVHSFSDGLAAYSDGYEWGWGFIDKKGNIAIRAREEWEDVSDFSNGIATVEVDGLWGLINKKGELILNAKFEDPLFFLNGLANVGRDDKVGFINKKGKWKIDPTYDEILLGFYNWRAIALYDNYYIFINRNGKRCGRKEFYDIDFLSSPGFLFVKSDFFDVDPIIDTLINNVSFEDINGLTGQTSVKDIMNIYDLEKSDLPQNEYRIYMEVQDFEIDDEVTIASTIYFDDNIAVKKTARVRVSRYYSYNKVIGYEPNPYAKIKSVLFSVQLEGRKEGKADKLAKGFKELFEKNQFNYDEDASTLNKYVLKTPGEGIEIIITFKDSDVDVEVDFKGN